MLLVSGKVLTYQNPISRLKIGLQSDSSFLVPSNQLLRPAGSQIYIGGRPVDMALSPDCKTMIVKNIWGIDLVRLRDRKIIQSLTYKSTGANSSSFTGICFSPDGKYIYLTDSGNHLCIAEMVEGNKLKWDRPIKLPSPEIGDMPFPGGVALNQDGNRIYVALDRNNSLGVVSLKDSTIQEIPVGMAPFDVILISSGKAYVSNWGGRRPEGNESTYNSSGSQILADPKTGIANNGSVSVVDLNVNKQVKSINVGLHPCGMTLNPDKSRLYVACANSDVISVISTVTDEVIETISVHLQSDIPFGSAPNDISVSPDGNFLFVANGTENAICVIQTKPAGHVIGYIPTGWYPGTVIQNKSGDTLYVANIKGIGSRSTSPGRPGFRSPGYLGTVSVIPVPQKREMKKLTRIVHENNSFSQMMAEIHPRHGKERMVPVPRLPGEKSIFKHVIYNKGK